MLRVICVCTGSKYDPIWIDNLKYMVDNFSKLNYDNFSVVDQEDYGDVFDKLQMFKKYRDGQNIYFDLDTVIRNDCNIFIKQKLNVCYAWWRDAHHTPLNSSIISWKGDQSHIYDMFNEDPEYYMLKYQLGIDQYIYENHYHRTFMEGFCSYQTIQEEKNYNVYLFNQRHEHLYKEGWWSKYLLPQFRNHFQDYQIEYQ